MSLGNWAIIMSGFQYRGPYSECHIQSIVTSLTRTWGHWC